MIGALGSLLGRGAGALAGGRGVGSVAQGLGQLMRRGPSSDPPQPAPPSAPGPTLAQMARPMDAAGRTTPDTSTGQERNQTLPAGRILLRGRTL